MVSEPGDVIGSSERDDYDAATQAGYLGVVLPQPREMLLAIQSTQIAEQDQDRRASQEAPSGERAAVRGPQLEIEVDSHARYQVPQSTAATFAPCQKAVGDLGYRQLGSA
jgi:hypothetical protein